MPDIQILPSLGGTQQRSVKLSGWFTIGAAGAITAQASVGTAFSGGQMCGVTVARQAAGDYRLTLHRGYKRAIRAIASVHHPAVATAPTATAGNTAFVQGITAAMFAGSAAVPATGLGITTVRGEDTLALADPTNGVTISYELELAEI